MRIALVTETFPPELNGVALTLARAVIHLRAAGHEVDVMRPRQAGDPAGQTPGGDWLSAGLPIPMYRGLRFGLARPGTLAARFEAVPPRLVHVATPGPLGFAAVTAANRLGLPTTSDFRTNFDQYSHFYRLGWMAPAITAYLRRLHNRTQRCFAPSRQTRDALLRAGFERVSVVGRGVDLERFTPARRDPALRRSWNAADAPVVLYVGRIAAEKNVALALQAFRCIREFVPMAKMVVVGDGPQRSHLEREYADVRFVGVQSGDALAAHYASADLFLFPSLSDTFGNVTLEALASGLPVVAFDAAAAAEFVVDRVNGRLVAPHDDQGFRMAACSLASRHCTLDALRVEARQAALRADWDVVLRGFEAQLLETVDEFEQARPSIACVA